MFLKKKRTKKSLIVTLILFLGILFTFNYILLNANENKNETKNIIIAGKLVRMAQPVPDVGYLYQINLDKPFYDDLKSDQGPHYVKYFIVVSADSVIFSDFEENVGKDVKLKGYIEWGLAETRHFKVLEVK